MFVRCKKCGTVDRSSKRPPNVGTRITMVCADCNSGKRNDYQRPLAELCRACCPTGHGTRWPEGER